MFLPLNIMLQQSRCAPLCHCHRRVKSLPGVPRTNHWHGSRREDETAVLAEQASQTGGGGLNKAVPARLVYRAASENQVSRDDNDCICGREGALLLPGHWPSSYYIELMQVLGRRETIIRVTTGRSMSRYSVPCGCIRNVMP